MDMPSMPMKDSTRTGHACLTLARQDAQNREGPWQVARCGESALAAVAAVASPALDAFLGGDSCDHKRGGGICPPPAGKCVCEQADE